MSSKDNDSTGAAVAIGMLAVAGIFVFAVLAFAAVIFTLIALYAWHEPRKIGKLTIMPYQAHMFVYGGLAGAVLLPMFAIFAKTMFEFHPEPGLFRYIVIGGYILGSMVGEHLAEGVEEPDQITLPIERLPAPELHRDGPSLQPFHFAAWDDEKQGQ